MSKQPPESEVQRTSFPNFRFCRLFRRRGLAYLSFSILISVSSEAWADDLRSLFSPRPLKPVQTTPAEDLPDLPKDENDTVVLIPECKGIVLLGNSSYVGNEKATGVTTVGLDVPGGESKLARRLDPFLGLPLTQSDINQIKRQIILYYREQHHPVMLVYIPEQKISHGVLQIVLIESRVGALLVTGNKHTPTHRIRDKIRLQPGDRIDEAKLLRDLSWINQNPFRSASALFSPGEKNGTTHIDIAVRDRRPWRIYGGGDNTGSPFTGEARWFTGINLENAFFPDNLLSYQFTTSSDFHKFKSHTLAYVAPFPWRQTLNIFGAYAVVHPDLTGFTSRGKSYQVSGRYTMPLWSTYPSSQQQLEVGFDFKGTNNNLLFGTDNIPIAKNLVNITQFVFSYHFGLDYPRQNIAAGAELFWSPGAMVPHQSSADFEALNPHAGPKYIYGKLSYSHQITLPHRWTFFAMGRLQLSDSSLLASEQFGLGGYNTVRGYRERVVNGDNALCINTEIRTPSFPVFKRPLKTSDLLYFLVFFDYGHAWDHKKIPGFPLQQTLMGIGPGFRYRISSYFTSRFDIGIPLHNIKEEKKKTRIHLSAVLSY